MGLSWSNFYEHPIKYSRRVYMAALSKVLVWALLAVSFLSFFNSWQSVSRFILLGSVGLGGFFVLIRFFILRSYCLDSQRKCRYQENILYVGNNNEIATFVTTLSNDISCSLNAVARFRFFYPKRLLLTKYRKPLASVNSWGLNPGCKLASFKIT